MMMSHKQRTYYLAKLWEHIACVWLRIKGYTILVRGFRGHSGEIDIIAGDGMTIVFVEVKFRRQKQDALEALSNRQMRNIEATSAAFLQSYPRFKQRDFRYDYIALYPFALKHFHNAWQRSNFAS